MRQEYAINFWLLPKKYSMYLHTILITKKSNVKKMTFVATSKV